jgi:hypothetical protein
VTGTLREGPGLYGAVVLARYNQFGLPATQARFARVGDVAIAPSGDLLVGDDSRIRSISR